MRAFVEYQKVRLRGNAVAMRLAVALSFWPGRSTGLSARWNGFSELRPWAMRWRCENIAVLYNDGEGVPEDAQEGNWFCPEGGVSDQSMNALGWKYLNGQDVQRNPDLPWNGSKRG